MRVERDVINGKVDWVTEDLDVIAIAAVIITLIVSLAVSACNISYTIYTPPEVRLQFDRQARHPLPT